jgi:osmotically inducible lipoprotein OsmB
MRAVVRRSYRQFNAAPTAPARAPADHPLVNGQGADMNRKRILLAAVLVSMLAGCGGMTVRERDTAIGAGIGAAAGAAVTNGDPLGTVGGAAVGGVIGNQVGK